MNLSSHSEHGSGELSERNKNVSLEKKTSNGNYLHRSQVKTNSNTSETASKSLTDTEKPVEADHSSVSEKARERLLAAVQKTPDPGQYKRPALRQESLDSRKPTGGAFNNLIQRMTGNKDSASQDKYAFLMKQRGNLSETGKTLDMKSETCTSTESDRLEIPAFLRRQAN